ncbi:MAG: histidine kinase [Balneolaceae bacterium]
MSNSSTLYNFLTENSQQRSSFEDPDKARKEFKDQKHFTVSLFDAMREGCLILDKKLHVISVNSVFEELFEVDKSNTTGKLLYDLGNGQWDIPDLRKLLENLLPEKKEINDFKVVHEFANIGKRVMILNARMINHLELILLAIEDITTRDTALDELNETRDNLEIKVKERTKQVHNLASRLSHSEQKERQRISGILHDDLQQLLVAIQMNLQSVNKKAENNSSINNIKDDLQESLTIIEKAIKSTRELTGDLNPVILKSQDLSKILEWLRDRFEKLYAFKIHLHIQTNFQIAEEALRVDILQILREGLFNVVKHAEIDNAEIMMEKSDDDFLVLQVNDEGKGFDLEQTDLSFGLSNIKDRIFLRDGELSINSAPGNGTQMKIRIPINQENILPFSNGK